MKKVVVIAVLLLCCSLSVFAGGSKEEAILSNEPALPFFVFKIVKKPVKPAVVLSSASAKAEFPVFFKKED